MLVLLSLNLKYSVDFRILDEIKLLQSFLFRQISFQLFGSDSWLIFSVLHSLNAKSDSIEISETTKRAFTTEYFVRTTILKSPTILNVL